MDSGQGNGRLNGCLDSDLQRRAGQRAIDKREHTSHRMGSAFFLWGISLDFPWFNLKTSESYINIMYMYRNLQLNHLLSFLFWFLVLKCWACKLGIHQCDPSSLWGSETADWGLGSGWESLCGFYITQALTNWLRESHQSTRYIYWDVTHFFFVAPFVSCIDIYIYMYITLFGGFVEKVVICDGLPAFVDSKFRFLSCSVFRGQHPMPRKMHFLLIPWWHIFKTNENKHYSKKYMLQPFSSKSQIIYNIWKLLYVEKWHQSQSEWNDS